MLSVAVVAAISFSACSSDDDNGGGDDDECRTCSIEAGGFEISSEYCDNGDGTMTVTTEGVEQTVDLEETSFSNFISALETGGATCD